MNQCAVCGGALRQEEITHTQAWGERLYRFERAPALVCVQCGEVWLEAEVSQWMDQAVEGKATPSRREEVPVFTFPPKTRAAGAG